MIVSTVGFVFLAVVVLTPAWLFACWLDSRATVIQEFAGDDSSLDLMDRPTG